MKNYLYILIILAFSCSKNSESYIEYLNGYWEIEKVILPNGNEKEYTFNETIDYISINDSLKGYRKKLKPSFNNTYITSDNVETIIAKFENDSLNIHYSTPYNNWKETVLSATSNQLIIINNEKLTYIYKKYTPITIE